MKEEHAKKRFCPIMSNNYKCKGGDCMFWNYYSGNCFIPIRIQTHRDRGED